MTNERTERDMLGEVTLRADALYGAQTARAAANFGSLSPRLADCPWLLHALAQVKAAAAEANLLLGVLEPDVAELIVRVSDEILTGQHDGEFPLALVQGGGGTSANMAVNEVIANRAAQLSGGALGRYEIVHPLDHVNRSQSTNDVLPTALAVAVLDCSPVAASGLDSVAESLDRLAARAGGDLRLGRTCLQDALPVPISAYHDAQATAVRRSAAALTAALEPLHEVPLGATAVGTGFGTPEGYRERAVASLAARTGLPLRPSRDPYDALAHIDPLLRVAAAVSTAAISLAKIAADIRLLGSGPIGGIGEVHIPAVQPGSSFMPGKVNPVVPELVLQASFEIRGAAHIVELAAAAGELELNVMDTLVARYLLDALVRLSEVASLFVKRCLDGLTWDSERVEQHLKGSLASAVERAIAEGHDTH